MDRLRFDGEIKFSADQTGAFSGYGAVFGNTDSYGDVIEKGAFKDTLRTWEERGKYPPMLLQHGGGFLGGADDLLPVGKWKSMEENSRGLKVEGELFALNTERGQYIYEGLKAGALDGLSIGFRTVKHRNGTKAGEPKRYLEKLELMELSIVTFPANDKARIGAVKSLADLSAEEIRELEAILRTKDLSRSDAAKAISGFKDWLRREAPAPITDLRDEGAADELAKMLRRNIATLS
ncbi:MAG: HK97 family phage prohead protease [Beijerinckiaceae bacterium]|nr:HK97 family phage prohead protease [Beijerinckiaceae bacterium]